MDMSYQEDFSKKEIDLKDLFFTLLKYKIFLILMSSFFAVSSVIYALSLPNIYTSSAVLTPADNDNMNNNSLGSMMSQYSGVASLAGIDLSSPTSIGGQLSIETIRSRLFLKNLLEKYDYIGPSLLAAKTYNEKDKSIEYNENAYNSINKTWVRNIPLGRQKIPTYIEIYDSYISAVSVTQDPITKFITLEVQHISPYFAYNLASAIIRELNNFTKLNDINESNKAINFLENRIKQTRESEVKFQINSLIISHLNRLMMADINENYLLEIVDPPYIPELRTSPKRSIICIMITVIGTLLTSFLIIVYHYNFASSPKEQPLKMET
jgi:uncharacterized protein involved in exopolysaccharide biosynthesis